MSKNADESQDESETQEQDLFIKYVTNRSSGTEMADNTSGATRRLCAAALVLVPSESMFWLQGTILAISSMNSFNFVAMDYVGDVTKDCRALPFLRHRDSVRRIQWCRLGLRVEPSDEFIQSRNFNSVAVKLGRILLLSRSLSSKAARFI